jgi:hypothetical protein
MSQARQRSMTRSILLKYALSGGCDSFGFDRIPCIFPVSREFMLPRDVRPSLPAQPPSRGIFASLAILAKVSARSPKMRHQLAAALSQVT